MPSKETEAVLKKVAHVHNDFDEYGDLKEPAVHIFNAEEREDREAELKRIDDQLKQPAWVNNRLSSERRGDMLNRAKDLRKQLDKYAPPDKLDGETMDALDKRRKELEVRIQETLLPVEVMWRNPAGAPDEHLKRERAIKSNILEWKNIVAFQNPHNRDNDLRNIERLRRSIGNSQGAATFMANARLPGNFAMTPQAKENWPENMPEFGTVDTPMKQAERREEEIKAMQEKIAALEAKFEQEAKKSPSGKKRGRPPKKKVAGEELSA